MQATKNMEVWNHYSIPVPPSKRCTKSVKFKKNDTIYIWRETAPFELAFSSLGAMLHTCEQKHNRKPSYSGFNLFHEHRVENIDMIRNQCKHVYMHTITKLKLVSNLGENNPQGYWLWGDRINRKGIQGPKSVAIPLEVLTGQSSPSPTHA